MSLPKVVQDWLANPVTPLVVTSATARTWDAAEIDYFNAWFKDAKANKGYQFDFGPGDAHTIHYVGDPAALKSHVFSGAPDARQATTAGAAEGGPFRRRYRTLSIDEVKHHDLIKDKASELWAAIEGIPDAREDPDPTVARDIALAKTHLEDSVMRAVRALTA